jgi:hypothetical protein
VGEEASGECVATSISRSRMSDLPEWVAYLGRPLKGVFLPHSAF